jgi:hypothetical protein
MNLLRILALLGKNDQASSEGMYEVLVDVMKRADTGINIGYAIGECLFVQCAFSSALAPLVVDEGIDLSAPFLASRSPFSR